MKLSAIITLMILFHHTLSCQPIGAPPGASFTFHSDQFTPSFTARIIAPHYSVHTGLLNLTFSRDIYGDNLYRISLYQPYGFAIVFPAYLIIGGDFEYHGVFPDSSLIKKILQVPLVIATSAIFLPNSQFHYNLARLDTLSSSNLVPSVFLGAQTDYYSGSRRKWLRCTPRIGFELFREFPHFALAIELGVTRSYDFVSGSTISRSAQLFAGVKFIAK